MNMDKKVYKRYAAAHAPHSPTGKNCLFAFLIGGSICTVGQGLRDLYEYACGIERTQASVWASVTLVAVAVFLTGIGVFDNIARVAGAGTLVPITGFANAVVSPAIDSKSEGFVLGIGAKIFTVAGPVLLYGILSGTVYGIVYYIVKLVSG